MCSEQWKTHFSVPAKAKLIGIWLQQDRRDWLTTVIGIDIKLLNILSVRVSRKVSFQVGD